VNVSTEVTRSGVPVISPFCVLNERPDGRVGEIDQVGKVPTTDGLITAVSVSSVKSYLDEP
jgi:hypothetical protein